MRAWIILCKVIINVDVVQQCVCHGLHSADFLCKSGRESILSSIRNVVQFGHERTKIKMLCVSGAQELVNLVLDCMGLIYDRE